MIAEEIEQRIQDINNEIHSLDSLMTSDDNVNIHMVTDIINDLTIEKYELIDILESFFDDLIGL